VQTVTQILGVSTVDARGGVLPVTPVATSGKRFSVTVINPRGKVLESVTVEVQGFGFSGELSKALDALVTKVQAEARELATAYMAQARKRSARATAAPKPRRRPAG
jgi:hypothetical protein